MQRRTVILLTVTLSLNAAERLIPLEGAKNFRDIGGYETVDGKHVRYGRVFRADALAKLTDADYEKLSTFGIRTICDFRSDVEREREATKWRAKGGAEIVVLDIMSANPALAGMDPTKSFVTKLMAPGSNADTASKMMADSMGEMALTGGPLYGKMMRRLLDSDAPLLYHCTAGKDRTGLATALLMKTLGVRDAEISADYLLVNRINPPELTAAEMVKRMEAMTGQKIDVETFKPLMGTKKEWLDGAFAAIDAKYGSFDNYRRQVLLISDEDQLKLKGRLLE